MSSNTKITGLSGACYCWNSVSFPQNPPFVLFALKHLVDLLAGLLHCVFRSGVQRYWYSGDKAGRIFSCRVIFFQPIAKYHILTESTHIWMNFSGDVLSAIASLLAISFPIVRLPVSIPEMCCRGTPPTLAPRASWVNPAFSR